MLKILDRYILTELLRLFTLVVVAPVLILTCVQLPNDVDLIIKYHTPVLEVLTLISHRIPGHIVMGLPMVYLFVTLMVIAQLAYDHEITTIRAVGLPVKRVIWPVLALSLVVCALSFALYEYIVPESNIKSRQLAETIRKYQAGEKPLLENKYFKGLDTRFFNIQRVDRENKTMYNVLIYDSRDQGARRNIAAPSGTWEGTYWTLYNGVVHEYTDTFVQKETSFDKMRVDARVRLESVLDESTAPEEMTIKQLNEVIESRKAGGLDVLNQEVELQFKYARPFAAFFAALIAAPLGFKFSRLGGYIGVALSIILIFVYYVTESISRHMGGLELISPFWAGWAPNVVFAIMGAFFLWRVEHS